MKISYNWLQSYFNKKLPKPEKVAEFLTMYSFEVERIEKKGKDYILDIDVLPNRAHDCLSHIGVAREISAILDYKIRNPKPKQIQSASRRTKLKINVKEPQLCRRYVGRSIKGVKVKQSPKWLQKRLKSIGQKSINNIVDVTNYVMLELGQPLHAFDADEVKGGIVVRRAKKREKITTLDNQEFELDESMLVIADEKKALAIAGIKGGKKAEVNINSKNIILEAANFNLKNIRKTSRRLSLSTDSSLRFENEISPTLAENAIDRLTELILDLAGGKLVSKADYYPKKATIYKIEIDSKDVSKLLGIEISEKEIINIFKKLDLGVKKIKPSRLSVTVPAERLDLRNKEDLIEEVARIYGYEKIPSELPLGILIPPKRNDNYFYAEIVRNILTGAGFSEVYNYSFFNKGMLEIKNPIAKDKRFLRRELLGGLKNNIDSNLRYFKSVRIFEIGRIFLTGGETISLAGIASNTEFYEIKGVVEMMLKKLGITDAWFKDSKSGVAEIMVGNTSLGIIDHNSWEINFEMLVRMAKEEAEYRPISRYPAINRDLSIFVPLNTKTIEVLDVIENTAGQLLIDTDLFDIFETEDRKSFAFHLVFQSHKKTLSDKEINKLMDKIIKSLDANPQWEVRRQI